MSSDRESSTPVESRVSLGALGEGEHPWERERREAVRTLRLVPAEPIFDRIASEAAEICGTPIGLVTAINGDDQLFLGRFGLDAQHTRRDTAICAHGLFWGETLVVPDAHRDARFRTFDTVIGEPYVRFYAGAPIHEPGGVPLGRVCVIDTQPRELRPAQVEEIQRLASLVDRMLSDRRETLERLEPSLARVGS